MIVIKIILGILGYIAVMVSIMFAVTVGVRAGLKLYFDTNKSSKGGRK